jgi:hypothetical protein
MSSVERELEIQVELIHAYAAILLNNIFIEHLHLHTDGTLGVVHAGVSLIRENKTKKFLVSIDKKDLHRIHKIEGIDTYFSNDKAYFIVPSLKLSLKDFIAYWNHTILNKEPRQNTKYNVLRVNFYGTEVAKITGDFSFFLLYDEEKFKKHKLLDNISVYVDKIYNDMRQDQVQLILDGGNKKEKDNWLFYEKPHSFYFNLHFSDYMLPFVENIAIKNLSALGRKRDFIAMLKNIYEKQYYERNIIFFETLHNIDFNKILFMFSTLILKDLGFKDDDIDETIREGLFSYFQTFMTVFDSKMSYDRLLEIEQMDEVSVELVGAKNTSIVQKDFIDSTRKYILNKIKEKSEEIKNKEKVLSLLLEFIDAYGNNYNYDKLRFDCFKTIINVPKKIKKKQELNITQSDLRGALTFFKDKLDIIKDEQVRFVDIIYLLFYTKSWEELKGYLR